MPGIAGLITRMPRIRAEHLLRRMIAALNHSPCTKSGLHIEEMLGVYVGWTTRTDSFAGRMPLGSDHGTVTLVFSGEEYPDPAILRRLESSNTVFSGEEPAHVVGLYEKDATFPCSLNGRFHGIVIDRKRKATIIFNDRYGLHRLYYHESPDAFYFSAEAKAILAVRPDLRSFDPQGLGEFVACGCVLENRTLFKGIRVLPGASVVRFGVGELERMETYFRPQDWENQEPLEPEQYYRELRSNFEQNLPRYFKSRERIGMSLTGGLDTRMIMAWRKPSPSSLPCYSFGGMFRDSQDVIIARRVAHVCDQTHEVIPVTETFLSRFPYYAERAVYLSDGCVDVEHAADLYLNEQAAQIAPVRMTGNYGGEVLRGVIAFRPIIPARGLFADALQTQIHAANETYKNLVKCHPLSFAVFRQAPWHHYGLLALEQTQVSVRSPFLDNDLVRTAYRAPQSCRAGSDLSWRLIADGDSRLARIRTDRGLSMRNGFSSTMVSTYMNLTFKAEYAYDYGMPQWMARIDHAFSHLRIERLFLGRHKFRHFRVWYRDALSDYVKHILLDRQTLSRSYIERRAVETIVNGHLQEGYNYTNEIHKLLTLELISRNLIAFSDFR